jgi:predicted HTH domain antitoxin
MTAEMSASKPYILEIPEDVLEEARIPRDERKGTLKRELALHLYARGLLPKAAARRLADLTRIVFDDLMGSRGIPSELGAEDIDEDLRNIAEWREVAG